MKKYGRLLLAGLMVFALVFTAVGCGGANESGDQNQKPVLKVGTNATFPPLKCKRITSLSDLTWI